MNKTIKTFLFAITVAMTAVSEEVSAEVRGELPDTLSGSLRSSKENDALQGELMFEKGLSTTTTARVGVSFFLSENTGLHGGFEAGMRANAPGKIAPFIGAGLLIGSWSTDELADSDGIDNDDDGVVDEIGEEAEVTDYLLATYPEAGVHLWLTEAVRLTASYRYYITTRGRDSDRALYGFGLGFAF